MFFLACLSIFISNVLTLHLTRPAPGDTIDVSFPYNITWTWDETDPPVIRIQITPSYEENTDVPTAAGIATFWADGDIVDVRAMVAGSPVQVQLVNNSNWEIVYTDVYPVNLVNSENISAAPSTYVTPVYGPTSLVQTSVPSSASALISTSQSHTTNMSAFMSSTTAGSVTISSAPTNAPTPATSSPESSHSGISTGAKAGIGVGTAMGAILLVILGFMLHKYAFLTTRRTNSQNAEPVLKPELECHEPQHQRYEMDPSQRFRSANPPHRDAGPGAQELDTS